MNLPQVNTQEWLDWRKTKIGASDIPIIMGVSPYCTPRQLWKRKLGFEKEPPMNQGMRYGHANESKVREQMQIKLGMRFDSIVMQHEELDWLIASLDGWNEENRVTIEIKSCNAQDHQIAKEGLVPEKYMPQLYGQNLVSKPKKHFYCSSHKDDLIIVDVTDQFYDFMKERIIVECAKFYDNLINYEAPPLLERDYNKIDDEEFGKAAIEWQKSKQMFDEAKKQEAYYRDQLISFTDDGNCEGYGVKLTRVQQEGRIDWEAVCKKYNIKKPDLESFRKEQIGYWKLSIMKETF